MLTLLDVSNFWSPTGGGVRRYHYEKLAAIEEHADVHYVLVVPSSERRTERRRNASIEHLPSSRLPGSGGYRQILGWSGLRELVRIHDPDLIECGSPWILPHLVRGLSDRAAVVGFWHADFPRAHFGRNAASIHASLGRVAEELGWAWARSTYGAFDAVLFASRRVAENAYRHGLRKIFLTPLGVHAELFHPDRRDAALVDRLRGGNARRTILAFVHRLNEEKGLGMVLRAHALLSLRLEVAPALVIAGLGPGRDEVERHAREFDHVHVLGYLDDPAEVARVLASADVALSLSAYETFGLSTVEAMACGTCVIAANEGGAAELVDRSGGGRTVPREASALADTLAALDENGGLQGLQALGARGRRYVEPATWSSAITTQLRAYREVVAAKSEGRVIESGIHALGPSMF